MVRNVVGRTAALSLALALTALAAHAQEPPLRHPFRGVELVEGGIPLLDIKDSPAGRRYAVIDQGGQLGENAPLVRKSGVVELVQSSIPNATRAALAREKAPEQRATAGAFSAAPRSPISPRLAAALAAARSATGSPPAEASSVARLPVEIHLERPIEETLQQQLDRAIARGDVATRSDLEAERSNLLAAKRARAAAAVGELAAWVERLGGKVTYRCRLGRCLTATLAPEQVEMLAAFDPSIAALDLVGPLRDAADSLDGVLINETYQVAQFWDFDWQDQGTNYHYDGDNGQSTDVTFAILERGGFRTTHKTYREGSGAATRIRGSFQCTNSACATKSSWTAAEQTFHATSAAGSVFGDYTDGQDAAVAAAEDRIERSSPGREGKGYLYKVNSTTSSSRVAFEHLVDRSPQPSIVSYSIPFDTGDPQCKGEDSLSRDVDEILYENGVLLFVAAGNSGGTATDCRIWSPAAAAGAFAVGGWGTTSSYDDACDARSAPMSPSSSWGGNTTEGKGRTIIGVSGSYVQAKRPSNTCDTCFGGFQGTSVATPSVSGSALAFIDMYKNELDDLIDDPGLLSAWMLLAGDRSKDGGKLTAKFDKRWGAGRLRLRMLNGPGMDAPWYYVSGWTCVDDGQEVFIPIANGAVLSSDINVARAVIWWYDPRLENGTEIDDLDLAWVRSNGTVLVNSTSPYDNRERVHLSGAGNKALSLRITGYDVTSDGSGCGSNSMKVYIAALLEDSDRDDANGPDWNGGTCEGVEPM